MVAPDANFIWSIADALRGPYRPKEYGTVVLPFTVLARFEARVLAVEAAWAAHHCAPPIWESPAAALAADW